MSDSAETTFKINDLLVSIVPASAGEIVPTEIFSGTILTNGAFFWPVGGGPLCGSDGQTASPAPGTTDPPLLAGVKALLRAQIAELEAQKTGEAAPSLMPTTPEQAALLETKLSAALDVVRRARAAFETEGSD